MEDLVNTKLRNVFARKKVLVTGHTGFKGSWLCLWLTELGANVVGYALEPRTQNDNFCVSKVDQRVRHIVGDIRDYEYLLAIFHSEQPEVVFHLAAQPIVRESYSQPKETYDINVGGTVNVLECCRFCDSVKVIINVTSDKCYDNQNWVWGYRENDVVGGYDPYSSSKACSELITGAYRNSFFNPASVALHHKSLSSVRAGNVIGGGDWAKDRIVPDSIRSLQQCEPIRMRNPGAVRPWQHVLEPLGGYLLLAAEMHEKPDAFAGAWNFGPCFDSFMSVRRLVEHVLGCWGSGTCEERPEESAPHEANLLALDTGKSRIKLGWKSIMDFTETVKLTVDWYKSYKNNSEMDRFCIAQITGYMERMSEFC